MQQQNVFRVSVIYEGVVGKYLNFLLSQKNVKIFFKNYFTLFPSISHLNLYTFAICIAKDKRGCIFRMKKVPYLLLWPSSRELSHPLCKP